jgi:hypothetical protein
MKLARTVLALLVSASLTAPAAAHDSVQSGVSASVMASMAVAAIPAWAAYHGSELTVRAVNATARGVELSLQGASGAIETSALVASDVISAASVGVGTSVQVVAESTGYALVAAGVLLAFVPNELGRSLLHSARH